MVVRPHTTFAALVIALALLLAACGGGDSPSDAQTTPDPAPQTPTTQTPDDGEPAPPPPAPGEPAPTGPAPDAPPPPTPPDEPEPEPAPGLDSAPPNLRVDLLIELSDPADNEILLAIGQAVAERRGLPLLQEVPVFLIRRGDIVAYLESGLDDADRRENLAFELSLRLLDLLDEDDDLAALQRDLFEGAVLGFYDPEIASFVIVSGNNVLASRDLDTITHEFVHALQDQHFQIGDTLERLSSNSDAGLAFRFIVEGDATVAEGLFGDLISEYSPRLQAAIDVLPGPSLTIPAIIEEIFFSPYIDGAFIVAALRNGPGVEGIDAILENPAASTEQLLHLEDPNIEPANLEPVILPDPNLRAALGTGWLLLGHDTLGEFIITEYLDQAFPRADAVRAGVGWGGDRLSVYGGPNDAGLLAWHTAWDTNQDAIEFFDLYAEFLRETTNDVVELAPGRTVAAADGVRSIWVTRLGDEVWIVAGTNAAAVVRVQADLSETLGLLPPANDEADDPAGD